MNTIPSWPVRVEDGRGATMIPQNNYPQKLQCLELRAAVLCHCAAPLTLLPVKQKGLGVLVSGKSSSSRGSRSSRSPW